MKRSPMNGKLNRNYDALYSVNFFSNARSLTPQQSKYSLNKDVEVTSLGHSSSEDEQTFKQSWNQDDNVESDLTLINDLNRDLRCYVQRNRPELAYNTYEREHGIINASINQANFKICNKNHISDSSSNDEFEDIEIIKFDDYDIGTMEMRTFEAANTETMLMYSLLTQDYFPESNVKIFELPKSEQTSPKNSTGPKSENEEYDERVPTPVAKGIVPPLRLSLNTTLPTVNEITESKSSRHTDKESVKTDTTSIISPKHLNNWIENNSAKICNDQDISASEVTRTILKEPLRTRRDLHIDGDQTDNQTKSTVSSQTQGLVSIELQASSDMVSMKSYDSHPNRDRSKPPTTDRSILNPFFDDFGSETEMNKLDADLEMNEESEIETRNNVTFTPTKVPSLHIPLNESDICEIGESNGNSVWSRLINCVMCK